MNEETQQEENGLELECLSGLRFFDSDFRYKNKTYPYKDIAHIVYTATVTQHSINGIPSGKSYEAKLRLVLKDESSLRIDQEGAFRAKNQKKNSEAVMQAAAIFHEITFNQRVERYETQMEKKGFVTWPPYQIGKNGDFFKNNVFLFNIHAKTSKLFLYPFNLELKNEAASLKEKLRKALWSGNETLDISLDKDCFLYIFKKYLGISWQNESVKEKKILGKHEFNEALLILGAKICKADGRVTSEEVHTFKTYFGIDDSTHPNASKIFKEAVNSSESVDKIAAKIYALFKPNEEPLEYIIIGLLKIAASDGDFSLSERNIIEQICKTFGFSNSRIHRLFVLFDESTGKQPSGSAELYIEYLEILGLSSGAALIEIKEAYKELARKHHPDLLKAKGVPIDQIKDSEEILKTINRAYQWLSKNHAQAA